jgi:hypothetical protein
MVDNNKRFETPDDKDLFFKDYDTCFQNFQHYHRLMWQNTLPFIVVIPTINVLMLIYLNLSLLDRLIFILVVDAILLFIAIYLVAKSSRFQEVELRFMRLLNIISKSSKNNLIEYPKLNRYVIGKPIFNNISTWWNHRNNLSMLYLLYRMVLFIFGIITFCLFTLYNPACAFWTTLIIYTMLNIMLEFTIHIKIKNANDLNTFPIECLKDIYGEQKYTEIYEPILNELKEKEN